MEGLVSGDVVRLQFPFTDLRRSKYRPALIIGHSTEGNYLLCEITSAFQNGPHALLMSDEEMREGHLLKISYTRRYYRYGGTHPSFSKSRSNHGSVSQ